MQPVDYAIAEPAIIFRRKRSGRLLPWVFDPEIERVDFVSISTWSFLFGGMTEAIVIDARGRRWTATRPRLAGIHTKHYRGQSLLSQAAVFLIGIVLLNISMKFRFLSVQEDKVTELEFREFILSLLEGQRRGFTRAPEDEVRARILKRKTFRGMINAVLNP
ncbi:hypothetical protein [Caulobacter sp. NIBR1757]|uniref:hypothetical protein n=1 Tax=Caulobacter sp. NIBR1757 TaxID=3016000 RepID=UPI0022F0354D|nr:hypothetical protein [Caulobacter sp. NIBR1757]